MAQARCLPTGFYTGSTAAIDAATGSALEVGTLTVSFPPGHQKGRIERPLKLFSISFEKEDPQAHVVLSELEPFGNDYAAWTDRIRRLGRRQAFIYVHGFETSFDQAALRAAQIAYDLDFDLERGFAGVPMFFSWPSRGGVGAYVADYDSSFESVGAFNRFLDLVRQDGGIDRVHVVAHSMGNRVVTEALFARSERGPVEAPILDQLVLAAPDVAASSFKERLLHTLPRLASRVTLYVSDRDGALIASRKIRQNEPRAGQVEGGLLEAGSGVERFNAIDASSLETDFLGHSYYASSHSMLSDIYCLLRGEPIESRPLLKTVGRILRFKDLEELKLIAPGSCGSPWIEPQSHGWLRALALASLLLGSGAFLLLWRRKRRGLSSAQ